MIVTKPLSQEAWQQIGWNGLQCLSDSAHTFIYAQRTADGRVAIGGGGVSYRYASGTGDAGSTAQSTVDPISEKLGPSSLVSSSKWTMPGRVLWALPVTGTATSKVYACRTHFGAPRRRCDLHR
jgi:hypothetical protein